MAKWYEFTADNGTLWGHYRVRTPEEYARMKAHVERLSGFVSLGEMPPEKAAKHEADYAHGAGLHNFDDIAKVSGWRLDHLVEEINQAVSHLTRSQRSTRYNREHTTEFKLRLVNRTEQDILSWLDRQENKSGAVKALIRKQIRREQGGGAPDGKSDE